MKPRWKREFTASEPPSPPCAIYGTLYSDGQPVGQGVTIQAVLEGKSRGEVVTNASGKFGYDPWLKFPEEGLHSSEIGATFEFWANQVKCEETYTVQEMGRRDPLDLHATGIPTGSADEIMEGIKSKLTQVRASMENIAGILNGVESDLPKLVEAAQPSNVPLTISGKRGVYSVNYLSEFITPRAKAVEDVAASLTDKSGDGLVQAAFNIIAPYPYIWDARIWGYDRWNMPHETLNMQCGDCEDGSFLLTSILLSAGVPRDRVRCALGTVTISGVEYGHAWVEYKRDDNQWYLLETTLDAWPGWKLLPAEYKPDIYFTDSTWEEISG
jgi:hypothetical protein